MGLFSSSKPKAIFPWKNIESIQMLDELVSLTQDNAVLIFKHSTRCSISMMALTRFESEWDLNISNCDLYFLDLIALMMVQRETPATCAACAGDMCKEVCKLSVNPSYLGAEV